MTRAGWDIIKQSKGFYLRTYRKLINAVFFSVLLNCMLGLVVYYLHANQPEPDCYATYGGTPPIQLVSMDAPNDTAYALLPSDPPDDNVTKPIPE